MPITDSLDFAYERGGGGGGATTKRHDGNPRLVFIVEEKKIKREW